jgi:hypothetical protein
MPIKEECCLCGKVLPYYSLRRCVRCRRLYCSTCIEYVADGNVMCLNCARRMVTPFKLGTKYSPLTRHLARKALYTDVVPLSFSQIEGIIGNDLPLSAYKTEEWWINTQSAQGHSWINVGWHVEGVDIEKRTVTFRREKGILLTEKKRETKSGAQKRMQKPLPKAMPYRRRMPSKTKMAKVVARLQNVERRRVAPRTYPGQPKSKPPYEKKMVRAKPDSGQ